MTYQTIRGEMGKIMKSFAELHHGEKVKSKVDGNILKVVIWRNETYLAGDKDMWLVTEFDPNDWEKTE